MKLLVLVLSMTAVQSWALPISPDEARETLCKNQAGIAATQIYHSCMQATQDPNVEQLRQEFQAQLDSMRKYYDTQIEELKNSKGKPVVTKKPVLATKLPPKKTLPAKKNVADITEPVIVLKPAPKAAVAPVRKAPAPKVEMRSSDELFLEELEALEPLPVPASAPIESTDLSLPQGSNFR